MPGIQIDTTYSIDREVCTWFGVDLLAGIADVENNIVEKSADERGWTQKPNGMGGVLQIYNPASLGELTLTIQMEHPLHLALKRLAIADRATRTIVGPVRRRRASGEIVVYQNARIKHLPDESVGMQSGNIEWVWIFTRKVPFPPLDQLNLIAAQP